MALALIVVLAPTVVGEVAALPLGSLLAAIYGGLRATSSNKKLAPPGKATVSTMLPRKVA
jgi:hypothetical protein